MEYMHVKVHGGGNEPDALEEFATALVAIADRDRDEIKALGVKPACAASPTVCCATRRSRSCAS